MKICIKCNIEKDDASFYKNTNKCKICRRKESNKLYYQNNHEKVKDSKKLYYQNNQEKIKEKTKLYYQNNQEKVKEKDKLYYQNNQEKIKETHKLYYQNNQEKIKEKTKLRRQKNLEKFMIKSARKRAKEKGLPFDLEESDIIIPEVCPALGIPLKIGEGFVSPNSPSLDRIIPEKGYVKGNIAVISNMANTIKSNATPEQVIAVGEYYKKLIQEANKNENNTAN